MIHTDEEALTREVLTEKSARYLNVLVLGDDGEEIDKTRIYFTTRDLSNRVTCGWLGMRYRVFSNLSGEQAVFGRVNKEDFLFFKQ